MAAVGEAERARAEVRRPGDVRQKRLFAGRFFGTVPRMRIREILQAGGRWGLLLAGALTVWGHDGVHPSASDAAASAALRLSRQWPAAARTKADETALAARLTPQERVALGAHHVRFTVNVPVEVAVVREVSSRGAPFWLTAGGFRRMPGTWRIGSDVFEVWLRQFPAGEIGLGVNGLTETDHHYFVLVRPLTPAPPLMVTDLYPGQLRVEPLQPGSQPWVDEETTLGVIPPLFQGWTLIRTRNELRNLAWLTRKVRTTPFPAGLQPDQIVLTWSLDPATSMTIQWRTAAAVTNGVVVFHRKPPPGEPVRPEDMLRVEALSQLLVDPGLSNDPAVYRHTAELRDLLPDTTYVYRVGDGRPGGWSAPMEFTTGPAGPADFSFVYMGDAQNGLDVWGRLVQGAARRHPDVAFYLMAGDLVNRGNERDDWDAFFRYSGGVFARRPLVPVIGNHECQGGHPTMYLKLFALPTNGPQGLEPGRAYSFRYGNARFVILDSNLRPEDQAAWLEEQLDDPEALWRFVAYHHPAYSSAPKRDNRRLREVWTPIFDRYGVDLALQGHDHAYLRTHPMRAGQPVPDPAQGTTYVVSVSGTKMYDQQPRPYTRVGFTRIPTYQVLDIHIQGNRLTYRAFDAAGRLRDQFVIVKPLPVPTPETVPAAEEATPEPAEAATAGAAGTSGTGTP
ncbi:MAG: metallophosphoesterase family protein [Verrucomicrobia bacterium]|nr:MAG: metallophosphoesterase family protein [Verrucomicrobiota bacterium]